MALTPWTDGRLTRLFERYRQRYWPTSRRLRAYRIQVSALGGAVYGMCDLRARVLHIDVTHHPSDGRVRSTVLHEMIHAALGLVRDGHGAAFWAELERLLARHAPITLDFGELGELGGSPGVIPRRFRRCRRLFRPVYERRQRALAREQMEEDAPLMPADIGGEFENAASSGALWRVLWLVKGRGYGFVTLDGDIVPGAAPYHRAARLGYLRGRRFFREDQRAKSRLVAAVAAAKVSEPKA